MLALDWRPCASCLGQAWCEKRFSLRLRQVAWVDAWALQISTAFVFLVLSVQAARVLSRSLPTASSPAPGLALACVRAWIVGAASTAMLDLSVPPGWAFWSYLKD